MVRDGRRRMDDRTTGEGLAAADEIDRSRIE
jgi:hypothetical protein